MLLQAENISGGYGRRIICHDICFSVRDGEMLCVAGPNGSGKSTLFRLLLRFNPLSGGRVTLDGEDMAQMTPSQLAAALAYIPQTHNPVFAYSVLELVLMGRAGHFSAFSVPKAVDEERAMDCLERLRIAQFAQRNYMELSGGQRQLVLIARALAQEAQVLIMDEPASALDYANSQLILEAVNDLRMQGYAVIMSTHSMDTPLACADRMLLLKEGRVHFYGTPLETLTPDNLEAVYGLPMDVFPVVDRNGCTRHVCLPVQREGLA